MAKRALSLFLCLALSAGLALFPVSAESLTGEDGAPAPLEMDEAAVAIHSASPTETDDALMQEAGDAGAPEEDAVFDGKDETEAEPVPQEEHDEVITVFSEETADTDLIEQNADDLLTVPTHELAGTVNQAQSFAACQAELQARGFETRQIVSEETAGVEVTLDGGYTVRAEIPAGAFAEEVIFFAGFQMWTELSDEEIAILTAEGITPDTDPVLFDIGFMDVSGLEVEPAIPVAMEISAKTVVDEPSVAGLSIQVDSLDNDGIIVNDEASPHPDDSAELEIDVYHINQSSGEPGESTLEVVASTDVSRLTVDTEAGDAGTVVIEDGVATATIEADSFSTYVLRVNNNTKASVSNGVTLMLNPRSSVTLRVYDAGNYLITSGVTWRSSNTSVVTVSSGGILTCVGTGTAIVTATVSGEAVTCTVSCNNSGTYAMYDANQEALIFFGYIGTPGVGTTFAYQDTIYTASEIYSNFESIPWVPWSSHNSTIRTVIFGTVVSPVSMSNWFTGCSELMEVYGTEWVNTSNVTTMFRLFSYCPKLKSLDLHTWDTSRVTNMAEMFLGCSSLSSLNLTDWFTMYVTDMTFMFGNCSSLTALDVSSFNTINVTSMRSMFFGCSKLGTLDVSSFYTINVTDMSGMFQGCESLTSLKMGYSTFFLTPAVTDMSSMFSDCVALKTIEGDLGNFDTANVTNMTNMFYNCRALKKVDVSGWNVGKVTNMGYMFGYCRALTEIDVSKWNPNKVEDMRSMFYYCDSLTTIDLHNWYTNSLKNASWMFGNCTAMTQADARWFAMSGLTDVSYIFYCCYGLKALHLGGWNTSGIINWTAAFGGVRCTALSTNNAVTLATGSNFTAGCYVIPQKACAIYDTAKTTLVFSNNEPYELIDFSGSKFLTYTGSIPSVGDTLTYQAVTYTADSVWTGFDTVAGYHPWTDNYADTMTRVVMAGQVSPVSLNSWFKNCTALTSVDVFRMNTANTTDMSSMFYGCTSLTNLGSALFLCDQANNVTSMYSMFYNCSSLTSLSLKNSSGSIYWKTGSVKNMANMFYGCTSLKSISGLELFDTSNVTNMTWMFGQCNSLTAVDLSSFDTGKVTSLDYMFYNCAALTSLDLSFFDTAGVTSMKYTFGSCTGLTSLNLSGWNTAAVTNWDRAFYRVNCNVLASNDSVTLAETPAGSITPGIYIAPQKVYAVFDSGNKALVFLRSFKTLVKDDIYTYPPLKAGDRFTYAGVTYTVTSAYSNVETATNVPWPAETRAAITSVIFTTEVRPVSTYAWFYGCAELTTITNLKNLNTADVTTMAYMFRECSSLTSLDLSGFNTAKVNSMQSMFYQCGNLETVNVSGFNTANVTSMGWMFYQCPKLKELDLSGFDTGKVTTMKSMFTGDAGLEQLDLSGFTMSAVEDISYMLRNCTGLTSLDLSGWDTGAVTEWTDAFLNVNCTVLASDNTKELAIEEGFVPGLYVLPIVEVFSVTVPAALTIYMDEGGEIHTATNAEIVNGSTGAVEVTSISVQGVSGSGWTLANSIDASTTPVNSKIFSMSVEANGEIASEGRKTVSYSAAVPAQSEAVAATEIARVVFTIAWAEAA